MTPTIYRIEFPSGATYIGATVNFKERRRTHMRHGRRGEAVNEKMRAEFAQCKHPTITPLASGFDRNTLHELEAVLIAQEMPTLNINMTPTAIPNEDCSMGKKFGRYASIKQAAFDMGVSYTTLKRAHAKHGAAAAGIDFARTKKKPPRVKLVGPPDPRENQFLLSVNGWQRKSELARALGVTKKTIAGRMGRGSTTLEAYTTPKGKTRPSCAPYVHPGPGVVARCCTRYDTNYHVFTDRKRRGWNTLQALGITQPPPQRKPQVRKATMTLQGITKTLDAWALSTGVKKATLVARKKFGWTDAQVLGQEPSVQANRENSARAARAEQASKRATKHITYKGVTGGISQVCRHFGIPDSQIRSRLKLGWTLEDAFEIKAGNYSARATKQ